MLLELWTRLTAGSLLGEMDADPLLDYWLGECFWLGMMIHLELLVRC
jgi:hypothetical protein